LEKKRVGKETWLGGHHPWIGIRKEGGPLGSLFYPHPSLRCGLPCGVIGNREKPSVRRGPGSGKVAQGGEGRIEEDPIVQQSLRKRYISLKKGGGI